MANKQHPVKRVLAIMEDWLGLPQSAYKVDVYWFATRLSPEEMLEAVEIARARLPDGGINGFKYFCGVCHRMIEKRKIRLSWN